MSSWNEPSTDPALVPVLEDPDPFVARALELLPAPRSARILDLGCGAGRHLVWLGRHGFTACGSDPAADALIRARARIVGEDQPVRVVRADLGAQPFAAGAFDAVVAHDTLSRARPERMRAAVDEVARVLRDEGLFVGTLCSTRDGAGLTPVDEAEARTLLAAFDVDSLALDEFSDDEGRRHSHWQFVAIRPPGS